MAKPSRYSQVKNQIQIQTTIHVDIVTHGLREHIFQCISCVDKKDVHCVSGKLKV